MSNKFSTFFWTVITVMSIACVIVQSYNITRMAKAVEYSDKSRQVLEQYVRHSFSSEVMYEECTAVELCNANLTDSTLAVFLPNSLCRACFSSLLFSLQDNDFPFQKVIVLSEQENPEVSSECLSRGIKHIVVNIPASELNSIILTCHSFDGRPSSMRYDIGNEYVLKMFLSNAYRKDNKVG